MNVTTATPSEEPFAGANLKLDTGATSFMFAATGLVQLMTPGLAMFYAGFLPSRVTVSVMIQAMVSHAVVFTIWVLCGFSCVFGTPLVTIRGYHLLGNPLTYFAWNHVDIYEPLQRASEVLVEDIPGMLFAAFQGMFAVITPGVLTGAAVARVRFWSFIILMPFWLLFVYAPLGYWNWGGGWMFQIGAWDFAGGIVVHEAAGFAGLALLVLMGKRIKPKRDGDLPLKTPHNLPLMCLGGAILWFGWFGFNGGSALSIGGVATIAFVNTQIAPSTAVVTWVLLERIFDGRPTLLGTMSGAITGLVVITPSAGFVQPLAAGMIGIIGSVVCFKACRIIDDLELDDGCDTVGVHGVAGFVGTLLVGVFSDGEECRFRGNAPKWCANPGTSIRSFHLFGIQFFVAVVAAVWSFCVTAALVKFLSLFGLFEYLDTEELQDTARDYQQHGEAAYVNLMPLLQQPHSEDMQNMSRMSEESRPLTTEGGLSDDEWGATGNEKDRWDEPNPQHGGHLASMRCLAICGAPKPTQ